MEDLEFLSRQCVRFREWQGGRFGDSPGQSHSPARIEEIY